MTEKNKAKTETLLKRKKPWEQAYNFFISGFLTNNSVWIAITFITLLILLGPEIRLAPNTYQLGDIARSTIRAKADTTVEDKTDLKERRSNARNNTPPVYDSYPGRTVENIDLIIKYFGTGRTVLANFLSKNNFSDVKSLTQSESYKSLQNKLISQLHRALPVKPDEEMLDYHIRRSFDKSLQEAAMELVRRVSRFSLVPSDDDIKNIRKKGFLKRIISDENEQVSLVVDTSDIRSLNKIPDLIYQQSVDIQQSTIDKLFLRRLVKLVVKPNLTLNPERTKQEQDKAAANIEPIYYKIKKGEVIVREGDIIDNLALTKINGISSETGRFNVYLAYAGLAIFLICYVIAINAYINFFIYRYLKVQHLFILFCVILILQVLLLKISFFVAETVGTHFLLSPFNKIDSYYYAMPFAVGAVLLTSLANQLIAIILAVSGGALTGILTEGNFYIALFAMVSSLAGIYGIRHYRERAAFIKAAMIVSLVNVIYVTAINFITGGFELVIFLFEVFLGFVGGFAISFFASFLAPLLESAFGIATDIKLLELSSMDRELLRELTIEAPGTYQHSVMVGILAEAAATEISANALFCRVAALYHDIGKIAKPDYFVENNPNAPKLHRKQKPHMSALIIVNHVKKGIQVAKEHKLPQSIIDTIPQHHGTRLIGSFYQMAQKQADPDIEVINEEDFRYPGPKPQTKEAAMIMIADTVEAASRILENPNPHKIRSTVEDLVNNIFLDGQLDECQLTFIELRKATESIIKKLTAIFHGRVEYPQFNFNKPTDEMKGVSGQNDKSS